MKIENILLNNEIYGLKKHFIIFFLLIITSLYGSEINKKEVNPDYNKIINKIEEMVKVMSNSSLDDKKIIKIWGSGFDHTKSGKFNKTREFETGDYIIKLFHSTKYKKSIPVRIELLFKNLKGFPISVLISVFGKKYFYDKRIKDSFISFIYSNKKGKKIIINGRRIKCLENNADIENCKISLLVFKIFVNYEKDNI